MSFSGICGDSPTFPLNEENAIDIDWKNFIVQFRKINGQFMFPVNDLCFQPIFMSDLYRLIEIDCELVPCQVTEDFSPQLLQFFYNIGSASANN